MMTRRDAVGSFAVLLELLATGGGAHAQNQTPQSGGQTGRPPVFKHDLPNVTMDDWEVTVSYVDYAPGRVGAPHRHPGFVLAYVLEGAVIAKISGQDERTYTAGQMFYEPPGSTHEVSRNASDTQPARLLAMIFAKKGLPLTTPVQQGRALIPQDDGASGARRTLSWLGVIFSTLMPGGTLNASV
jgi:quercetin dioxygenase-like cupin family protein